MRTLLHVCCAPCALGVIDNVQRDNDITLYFYNPNLYPFKEYEKRLDALKEVVERAYPDLQIIEGDFDDALFYARVLGLEEEKEGGTRCAACIRLRMEMTAKYAKENGFEAFTTTLSVSPHKSYPLINKIGKELEEIYNIKFIDTDFKKKDGFLKSTKRSKEMGIYRQNYCGCKFSKHD